MLPRRGSSIISSRLSLLAAVLPPLLTGCSKGNFSNFTPRSTDLGSSISLTFLFGSLVALRDILLLIDNQQPVLCSLSLFSSFREREGDKCSAGAIVRSAPSSLHEIRPIPNQFVSRNRFRSRRRRKPGEGREKGRQNKLIPPFILSPSGTKGGRVRA